jgi:hypothetical protein
MLRRLQLWHLLGILLVVVLYSAFFIMSEPEDQFRRSLEIAGAIAASSWSACFVCYMLIGGPDADLKKMLIEAWRRLASNRWFLIPANLILSVLVVVLCFF